jgi:hypothetical protein
MRALDERLRPLTEAFRRFRDTPLYRLQRLAQRRAAEERRPIADEKEAAERRREAIRATFHGALPPPASPSPLVAEIKKLGALVERGIEQRTPQAPTPWSGTRKSWLFEIGFRDHPKRPDEPLFSPRQPDDYCRRLARIAKEKTGLVIAPSTINVHYPRP